MCVWRPDGQQGTLHSVSAETAWGWNNIIDDAICCAAQPIHHCYKQILQLICTGGRLYVHSCSAVLNQMRIASMQAQLGTWCFGTCCLWCQLTTIAFTCGWTKRVDQGVLHLHTWPIRIIVNLNLFDIISNGAFCCTTNLCVCSQHIW